MNSYGTVNNSNDINIPYGSCLLPSNAKSRQSPSSSTFGNGTDNTDCVPQMIKSIPQIGLENKFKTDLISLTLL